MKTLNILFVLFLMMNGCSNKPRLGDVYEEISTGERLTIAEIKTGKQLIEGYDELIRVEMLKTDKSELDKLTIEKYKLGKESIKESELYIYLRKSYESRSDNYDIERYWPYYLVDGSHTFKKLN